MVPNVRKPFPVAKSTLVALALLGGCLALSTVQSSAAASAVQPMPSSAQKPVPLATLSDVLDHAPVVVKTNDGEALLIESVIPPSPRVEVTLFNENTRQMLTMYLPSDLSELTKEEEREVSGLLRCKRTGRMRRIHSRVIEVLVDLSQQYPGHVIDIISGYRAPPYGAPNSKHFRGLAVDLRVRDVPIKDVRAYLWGKHDHIGLGHYRHQQFLHIDHRPIEPKIGWDQFGHKGRYRYHPRWTTPGQS
jgi:uncharacterized protein YcbK (DUF882 family)